MNRISKITVENVKGKEKLELKFDDLYANKPNLLVAANGFGKSTIAQAFASIKPTKIDLKNDLLYDQAKEPKIEVELELDDGNSNVFVADSSKNDFNSDFDIKVINNAVVAKSSYSTAGAHLKINPIEIYKSIPPKIDLQYSLSKISSELKCPSKILYNLTSSLENIKNLNNLLDIETELFRAANNKTAQNKIEKFISKIDPKKSKIIIMSQIDNYSIEELLSDKNINTVFNIVTSFDCTIQMKKSEQVLSTLQVIIWYRLRSSSDNHFLKKIIEYKTYKANRDIIDKRLEIFNTTNRVIKTEKDDQKLVLKFFNATAMSNGERDVLVFITELFCFQISMKHNNAILIIDEVFDYLDGSNLLVAQYYLSCFIKDCKKKGKVVFPMLFTHLDPHAFNNYYFKHKKIHYLIKAGTQCLNSDIAKIIQGRESKKDNDFVSKYLLHYNNKNVDIPKEILNITSENFPSNTNGFKSLAYTEVEKYLKDETYNPLLVSIGIRVKVEEIAFNRTPDDKKEEFLKTHKTINKLEYTEKFTELEEILFLLQPLYNDPLHLDSNTNNNKSKINGCAIKLYSKQVKNIIRILFSIEA